MAHNNSSASDEEWSLFQTRKDHSNTYKTRKSPLSVQSLHNIKHLSSHDIWCVWDISILHDLHWRVKSALTKLLPLHTHTKKRGGGAQVPLPPGQTKQSLITAQTNLHKVHGINWFVAFSSKSKIVFVHLVHACLFGAIVVAWVFALVFFICLTWGSVVIFFCINWQVFPHHTQSYWDFFVTLRYNTIQSNVTS